MNDAFAGDAATRACVYGSNGMIVSGHSLASLAGLHALERGGSAADALIAASAVLAVVIPQATSLGGDAFTLYRPAAGQRTHGLNATGTASAELPVGSYDQGIPTTGARSLTVPGLVRGWQRLHERFGRLAFGSLLADAIELAESHPASALLCAGLVTHSANLNRDPGCRAIFLNPDAPRHAGDDFRQPHLARTLKAIADGGPSAFYDGPIARSLTQIVSAAGGHLSLDDLRAYDARWCEPIGVPYRGLTVEVMPPNSFGLLLLLQARALDTIEPASLCGPDTDRLERLIRAARAAMAVGATHIADAEFYDAPLTALLGPAGLAPLLAQLRESGTGPGRQAAGGTSCIAVMDKDRNAAVTVQSVFHPFGAAFADPQTGIVFNNRLTGFSIDPNSPNRIAAGKRPAHTLNPTLVHDGERTRMLLATPGGPSQTITLMQVLSNRLDRGLSLAAAVEAPRWGLDLGGNTLLEDGLPIDCGVALARRGLNTQRASGALYFGSAKVIERLDSDNYAGFADHRREAFAIGY